VKGDDAMTTMGADTATANYQTQTLIEAAQEMVCAYGPSEVPEMNELEMANAIGRLTATLTMLLAAVRQPLPTAPSATETVPAPMP
jgi:hypothetical protein